MHLITGRLPVQIINDRRYGFVSCGIFDIRKSPVTLQHATMHLVGQGKVIYLPMQHCIFKIWLHQYGSRMYQSHEVLSVSGLLWTSTSSPSWIFQSLVPELIVIGDVLVFVYGLCAWWLNIWDRHQKSQDRNKEFPGRRRPVETCSVSRDNHSPLDNFYAVLPITFPT